jgi:hypothetical protein
MLDDEVGELSPIPATNRDNDVVKRNSDSFFAWCCDLLTLFCRFNRFVFMKKTLSRELGTAPLPLPDIFDL